MSTSPLTATAQAAYTKIRMIKAPTKRTTATVAAILEMTNQADVDSLTRQLRIDAGAQDVALLPDTAWNMFRSGNYQVPVETVGTAVLANTLDGAEDVTISWPSVYSHWGVMVTFTWGGQTIVARSKDYQLTETYMSA
jgi:hypothetical protein